MFVPLLLILTPCRIGRFYLPFNSTNEEIVIMPSRTRSLVSAACETTLQWIYTRSSADADNALDAFSGQSRPCGISDGTLTHVRHMTLLVFFSNFVPKTHRF